MQVADKDLFVFADDCVSQRCSKSDACDDSKCRLCKHCLADEDVDVLRSAYLVISHNQNTRQVFFIFALLLEYILVVRRWVF